ncbi:MAG: thermosome subunit beta [Candidatus Thalassarchaeum sp.]|jgi:chaperonin GroEL (HSP60 family)|nr:thermosome subunit beta [Candidatus Thalassarchaeum sp.]MDP7003497.1 thermosome subunit beta [Candidatus Thalassarchaeaceae archaeon]
MVESEQDLALEDTERMHGREALVNNVKAASSLAGAIRSTLGPKGLDKMLVESDGSALVTNDGVTVLETAQVEHPTARLLIEASSSQDRAARDGTTTAVLLVSEMLHNALELVRMGVHPSVIVNGYRIALEEALEEIERVAREADETQRLQVVRTTLEGKADSGLCDLFADLAIRAADDLSEEDGGGDLERLRVKRLQVRQGNVMDSSLVQGLMLPKSRVDISTPASSGGGIVAIVDGGLEHPKLEISAKIEVNSPGVIQDFHDRAIENLQRQVDHLASLGVDLLIVRDGIEDEGISLLTKAGITAYRRFERTDLELLSKMTGAKLSRDTLHIDEGALGSYAGRSEEVIAEVKHTLIEGTQEGAMTLVVRGSSPTVREEATRVFDDAMGVAHRLTSKPGILPGGGAIQTHLARHLRAFAPSQAGREQLAIEGYSAALEIVPRALADNGGFDPVDVILALSADQSESGAWIGFDLGKGENGDMGEAGILDPLFVVRHGLSGATEAAISVLRIDDVLWAKTEIGTPDWKDEDESED